MNTLKRMDKKVNLDSILQLFNLFTEKNWIHMDSYKEVLTRFGNLFESLNPEQTELLLELVERYIWLSFGEYQNLLRKLFIELYETKLQSVSKLYLFPIKRVNDEDELKSGDIIQYMLKGVLSFIDKYAIIEKVPLNKFDQLNNENLQLKKNEHIVFIDDYIGSGKTLQSTLDVASKNSSIENNFSILSTIIQEDTILMLKEREINVLYGKSMKKGITNYYKDDDLKNKIRIMTEIEERIPLVERFSFGFEKSEGLATLIRTPNNTFPIFWKEHEYKKEKVRPPFPRY